MLLACVGTDSAVPYHRALYQTRPYVLLPVCSSVFFRPRRPTCTCTCNATPNYAALHFCHAFSGPPRGTICDEGPRIAILNSRAMGDEKSYLPRQPRNRLDKYSHPISAHRVLETSSPALPVRSNLRHRRSAVESGLSSIGVNLRLA
jgi:hypothetical protein